MNDIKKMEVYPSKLAVSGPNKTTVEWIKRTKSKHVAELGVYEGYTSIEIAKILPANGSMDLFDFDDVVKKVAERAKKVSKCQIRPHGNSYKLRDSYCWSIRKLLKNKPMWDYIFIDGPHTWDVDGFAFLLCDMLLKPGGYVDFDDYHWTLKSGTIGKLEITKECYTPDQMDTRQVAEICTLLVPRLGYSEVVKNKIYRKPKS